MATKDNLQEAFAGESQANRKYLAFAKAADKDGFANLAKLFRATAHAETIHAHAHFRAMGGINSTVENLEAAIGGEEFEFKQMYPKFIEEAEAEGEKSALMSFKNANTVEETHYNLYAAALEKIKAGEDIEAGTISVCPVCGHTVIGDVPDRCPVCGVPGPKFEQID